MHKTWKSILLAVVLFVGSVALVIGCGGTVDTGNKQPTEKQSSKDKRPKS